MRSAYSERKRHTISFAKTGKTAQYFKDEVNINNIMEKYRTQGVVWTTQARPQYGDFTQVVDYQTAQNALIQAQESFSGLPANVRAYFANDPQKFVEFCENQDNLEEMRRLGLAPEAQQIPEPILKNETAETSGT